MPCQTITGEPLHDVDLCTAHVKTETPIEIAGHDVQWTGTFRGTDQDPRETGWCVTCRREVYDGEGEDHRQEGDLFR